MVTNAPVVRIDRETETQVQLKTLEIALYQMADMINRIRPNGQLQYTKIAVPQGGS